MGVNYSRVQVNCSRASVKLHLSCTIVLKELKNIAIFNCAKILMNCYAHIVWLNNTLVTEECAMKPETHKLCD